MKDSDTLVLIDDEYVSLRVHRRDKIVHHELRKFVHGERLRNVLNQGLDAFIRYGASKWLSDDRGNGALSASDSEWARTSWSPRVMAANWKFWAVVLPENVIGQMNMKMWMKAYADQGVIAQPFSDPIEAMEWLKRQ